MLLRYAHCFARAEDAINRSLPLPLHLADTLPNVCKFVRTIWIQFLVPVPLLLHLLPDVERFSHAIVRNRLRNHL